MKTVIISKKEKVVVKKKEKKVITPEQKKKISKVDDVKEKKKSYKGLAKKHIKLLFKELDMPYNEKAEKLVEVIEKLHAKNQKAKGVVAVKKPRVLTPKPTKKKVKVTSAVEDFQATIDTITAAFEPLGLTLDSQEESDGSYNCYYAGDIPITVTRLVKSLKDLKAEVVDDTTFQGENFQAITYSETPEGADAEVFYVLISFVM
jgi:hypothetical protein